MPCWQRVHKVDILEARQTSQSTAEQKFKQSGITLAVGSPVLGAIEQAQSLAQAAGNTQDARMKALAGASAAWNIYNNAQEIGSAAQALASGNPQNAVSLTASIGTSQSQSVQHSQSDSAKGSSVTAGGSVTLSALGAGQASNLLIQGSSIQAGRQQRQPGSGQPDRAAGRAKHRRPKRHQHQQLRQSGRELRRRRLRDQCFSIPRQRLQRRCG